MTLMGSKKPKQSNEDFVVEVFNNLVTSNIDDPLLRHLIREYGPVVKQIAYTLYATLSENVWPDDVKVPRQPDIERLFTLGFVVGYAVRAGEKAKK